MTQLAKRDNRILWLPGEERMWDDDAGSRSAAGVRIDANNAHQVSAVFACLRVIAETVASLPLHVLERTPGGGKRIARELPLYRQLHAQPNGWQTSFEWREQAVFHVGLWGDAFSELKAGEIQPLHPSRMKIERLENGRLRYQYREEKGTQRPINESLILQVRGPSDDGVNGLRIVEECKDAIALARACELHGARFFGNGARPGFVLSTDGTLNAEAREQLRSQWDRRHAGVGNSHSTAVLTGGLKPYEIPQSSNSDAQFLELRRYQLEEIARLYRCPGWLLGIGTAGPQSEMEFVTHTILPWLRRFESAFMRDLIADDDRYLIEFDVRGLMRGDAASRSAYYRSMWDIGVLSTDDIRELENMDPVEGGEVRYRPLNMGTLGAPPSVEDVLAQQQPGSGIDGQAVEGGVAAAEGEAEPVAEPASETSLTTAEVSSLLTVVKQITDGLLSIDAARAIIAAAFPVLSPARVETILQGVQAPEPEPVPEPVAEEPAQEPVAEEPAERAAPGSIVEGQWVTWGDGLIGKVDHVMTEGVLNQGDIEIPASPEAPVMLVSVWSDGEFTGQVPVMVADAMVTEEPETSAYGKKRKPARRDCGTGAGGFKPGNKCAGGGDGGGADSSGGGSSGGGDSAGGPGSGVEQAKAGDGPLVKAARDEHKKALDRFRKGIETANNKAKEKHAKAMEDHIAAKENLSRQWDEVNRLTMEVDNLTAEAQASSGDDSKWQKVREAGQALTQARLGLEPAEKAEAAAKKAKEKAAQGVREATAKAFAKEIAAVDKEDGLTASERKTISDAVARHNQRGESFAGTGFESEQLARSAYAAGVRQESQDYLRDHVNNAIHSSALQGRIEYADGIRASASGGVLLKSDGDEVGFVGTTKLDPTDSQRTFVHEFGHQIEHGNPEARSLCEDFLRSRVGDDSPKSFKELYPTAAYRDDEKGLMDDFAKAHMAVGYDEAEAVRRAYYAGKDYGPPAGRKDITGLFATPTEVLSMGMELMYRDAIAFSKADPEWFDLVSGISTGRLLTKTRAKRKKGG